MTTEGRDEALDNNSMVSSLRPSYSTVQTAGMGYEPSTLNSTIPSPTKGGVSGGVIAGVILLFVLAAATVALILYLRRSGKLQRFTLLKPTVRARRDSSSSSRRPLEPDDIDRDGEMERTDFPKPRDGEMFTIEDFEVDIGDGDRQSRGTNDEYFYDEVFGKSGFEDEATKASIRQLYLTSDDDEMFDVDAIVRSVTDDKSALSKA